MRASRSIHVFLGFTLLTAVACTKADPPPAPAASASPSKPSAEAKNAPPAASAAAPAAPAGVSAMKALTKDDLPKDIKAPRGKIEKVVGYSDKNGDNVVVFSRASKSGKSDDGLVESAYLEVLHLVSSAGGPTKVLRTVKDQVEKCDADLTVTFRDAALEVTDLDKDGFGEVTFAYSLACASDMSPATLKLLVLENGDKYILRGTTRVPKMGDDPALGGEYQIDASFKDGPPAFLEHAKASWAKVRAH